MSKIKINDISFDNDLDAYDDEDQFIQEESQKSYQEQKKFQKEIHRSLKQKAFAPRKSGWD